MNGHPVLNSAGEKFGHDPMVRRAMAFFGVGIAVLVPLLLLGYAAKALFVVFGGVLTAVFLRALVDLVTRFLHLSEGKSLALVVVLLMALTALTIWWTAPRMSDQFGQLADQLPHSLQHLKQQLEQFPWGKWIVSTARQSEHAAQDPQRAVSEAADALSVTFEVLGSFIIMLFLGIYFAVEPCLYLHGALRLLPIGQRDRVRAAILDARVTLQRWLVGRLFAMAFVGVFTGLGLWLLNVRLAFSLGLLAGLLGFIPYIGPLVSGVPALLLTVQDQGTTGALYVVALYFGVQTVQDYILTPLIQRWTVSLPPALTITSQILMGIWVGSVGVTFATPLTVVLMVLVKKLYVEGYLENPVKEDRPLPQVKSHA